MRRRRRGDDAGSATFFVAGMLASFLAFLGLVVDGGQILASRRDAANVAEEAARAGVQQIDEDVLRETGQVSVAPNAEAVALSKIPASIEGATITGRSANCAGTQCTVTITIRRSTTLLQMVGVGETRATVTGRARIARGVEFEEG